MYDVLDRRPWLGQGSTAVSVVSLEERIALHRRSLSLPPGVWTLLRQPLSISSGEFARLLGDEPNTPADGRAPWERALITAVSGGHVIPLEWPVDGQLRSILVIGDGERAVAITRPTEGESGPQLAAPVTAAGEVAVRGCWRYHARTLEQFIAGSATHLRQPASRFDVSTQVRGLLASQRQLPGMEDVPGLPAPALFNLALSGAVAQVRLDGRELLATLPGAGGDVILSPCGCRRPATVACKAGYMIPTRSPGRRAARAAREPRGAVSGA